ncbi:MAG: hypothetical protein M1376_23445 [Planctomycetes bacterium]|nr:hypothetical protein [Planctomycetota bacterium]
MRKPTHRRRKGRPWSDLEIKLLRDLYSDPDTLLEEIAAQLIGRSLSAVQRIAHILGLRRLNPWTEEEIALLRQFWPERTPSELAGMLKRSWRAIKHKARSLGLRRRPPATADSGDQEEAPAARERNARRRVLRPWSEEEVKYLKHMYPRTHSPEEIAKGLESRSAVSIRGKAWELGLTRKWGWTAEEDNLIREYYHLGLSWRKIAKRLNRSRPGVQRRARALGLEREGPQLWTDREDGFLREHWSKRDAGELAEQLDRTVRAVETRAQKLGLLDKRNWWTERDEAFLLEHWQDKPYAWIAQQLNRPLDTVSSYAHRLGLRKRQQQLWTEQDIRILKSMHGRATVTKIARRLKRSVASVSWQMAKLGLAAYRPSVWTPEEEERLRTLYRRHSLKEMAEQLGRSVPAVQTKIRDLGLSRPAHRASSST